MTLDIRKQFPIFDDDKTGPDWVYFDSAATSQKPKQVIDTITHFYQAENANVHRASHTLATQTTGRFEQARVSVQHFINARSEKEIVWTKGATEAINLVANGLGKGWFSAGDRIVLSATEHHGNLVPWLALAKEQKLIVDVIPIDTDGVLDIEAGLALLEDKTALLALGHVSNALGNINPVDVLIAKAKEQGALTLLDGAQASAHLSIDVQKLDCDFYVFSGHKMFAPTGIGVLYGKFEALKKLPVYQLGGEMIERVSFDNVTYQAPPFKFEAGTPNIEGVLGLASAIDFIQSHRLDIEQAERNLYQYLIDKLSAVPGIRLLGDTKQTVATQSFIIEGINNQDLGLLLNEQNIAVRVGHHCAMPLMQALGIDGTIRVSLACYNQTQEIDRFVEALLTSIARLSDPETACRPVGKIKLKTPINGGLGDKLKATKGWQEVYRQIMLAGKAIQPLADEQKTADNEVFGCESQVWLKISVSNNCLSVQFYSPSKIVRGLLAILLEPIQQVSLQSVLAFDGLAYLKELGLDKHLSQSRGNGLKAVLDVVHQSVEQRLKRSD